MIGTKATGLAPLLMGLLLIAPAGQSASFDCSKAATKVEKMVCADPELSKRDDGLSAAYMNALREGPQADTIKLDQQQWMKRRDKCSDVLCGKLAYEDRSQGLTAETEGSHELVSNKEEKDAPISPYILVMSKNNNLCESMLGVYNTDMNAHGRIEYKSHEYFSQINWKDIDSLGPTPYRMPKKAIFDIYNDGKDELVIKVNWQINYLMFDDLYIFPADSDVLSKLFRGSGGGKALLGAPNVLFGDGSNSVYELKQVPKSLQEQIAEYKFRQLRKDGEFKDKDDATLRSQIEKPQIGPSYVLEPFIWKSEAYISMTDQRREWIAVGKYKGAKELQDICYYYDESHKVTRR